MKLASLKSGGRDGSLVIVSRDLTQAVHARGIVGTLAEAIEEWSIIAPKLHKLSNDLNARTALGIFDFDPCEMAAPLPRAAQWCDGSAYLNHAELVRQARNAEMPESLYRDPMLYQGASDVFLGSRDDILIADESWGIDLEGEIAVITDDVPMGIPVHQAGEHIKLVMLVNDVSLRNLIPAELAKGFGFFVSKPATAFSTVAVTPDELGAAWDGTKLSLPLETWVNGQVLGRPNAGVDLNFDFPHLIAHAATSRELKAGTIIGSGTVSNRDRSAGSACLQEKRMIEKLQYNEMRTSLLKFGDVVRVEMFDAAGETIFGRIEQRVVRYEYRSNDRARATA